MRQEMICCDHCGKPLLKVEDAESLENTFLDEVKTPKGCFIVELCDECKDGLDKVVEEFLGFSEVDYD